MVLEINTRVTSNYETTTRIAFSCLPFIGTIMMIYNLSQSYLQQNQIRKKSDRLCSESSKIKDLTNKIENQISVADKAISQVRSEQDAAERILDETRMQVEAAADIAPGNNMNASHLESIEKLVDSTNEKLRAIDKLDQKQHILDLDQQTQITNTNITELNERYDRLREESKELVKVFERNQNQTLRFYKYSLVSSSLSLLSIISLVALNIFRDLSAFSIIPYAYTVIIGFSASMICA